MESNISTLGITPPEDEKYSSGIGYIALPSDIDRQTYITDCYRNFRVSLRTAHDGHMNRVSISEQDLNWIDFPDDYTKLGSPVYYIVDPINYQPYIVKVFKTVSTLGSGSENKFRIGRQYGNSYIEVSGNPAAGNLTLSVANDNQSELNLIVQNKNDNGKLNILTKGDVNVKSTGNNSFYQNGIFYSKSYDPADAKKYSELIQDETNFSLLSDTQSFNADTSVDINSPTTTVNSQNMAVTASEEYDITTKLLKVNNGQENFILGQKFKSFMTDLINEISRSLVTTALGTMPLTNASQIAQYTQKIDDFLSQVGYIDK